MEDEVGGFEVGVVVSAAGGGFRSALNGCLWAPLQAGHTLFALVLPGGTALLHDDIADRADPGAKTASVACGIGEEFRVALRKVWNPKTVDKS